MRKALPSQAKMNKREEFLRYIVAHIDDVNPINIIWDRYCDEKGLAREWTKDGYAKLRNYYGFDIKYLHFDHADGARIVLEYEGKPVLNMIREYHVDESSPNKKKIELRVDEFKPGDWEKAFENIIQMGRDDALRGYFEMWENGMKKLEGKRSAEQNKRDNRELALCQKENRAVRLGFKS